MGRLIDALDAWLLAHPTDAAAIRLRHQQVDGLARALDRLGTTPGGFFHRPEGDPTGPDAYPADPGPKNAAEGHWGTPHADHAALARVVPGVRR
jgi:hypothetical protein